MALKGVIQSGHIPVNKFKLLVVGVIPLTPITVSGIEEELETIDLPDRTKASGGQTKAGTFTAKFAEHHKAEIDGLEKWFNDSQDPVDPAYKKPVTLTRESIDGKQVRSWSLTGVFPTKRKLPDLEMKNEGQMGEMDYTFSFDDITAQ